MRRCWASGRDRNGIEGRCTMDGKGTAAQKPLRVPATRSGFAYCLLQDLAYTKWTRPKPKTKHVALFCTRRVVTAILNSTIR